MFLHTHSGRDSRLATILLILSPLFLLGQEDGCDQDTDGDGWTLEEGDCDDTNPAVHPGASELCDTLDNDCDGEIDEDPDAEDGIWYLDADGDGYGTDGSSQQSCEAPEDTYVLLGGDCDDADPRVHPSAEELCDDIDNDCNGLVDDDPDVGGSLFPMDGDGDGFGDPSEEELACTGPDNTLDCNDETATEPQVVVADADERIADGSRDFPWARIQDGIAVANECVVVFPGTYLEAIDFGGKALQVTSTEGAEATIIDASDTDAPVVTIAEGETPGTTLSGFTLTGGEGHLDSSWEDSSCGSSDTCTTFYLSYCGGGVYVKGAQPSLSDLIITENTLPEASTEEDGNATYHTYSFGGGICTIDATVRLTQVHVWHNFADVGGGIYVDPSSAVTALEGYLGGNGATEGGGIAVDGGTLEIRNLVFSFNAATEAGGGVMVMDGALLESNVTHGGDDSPMGGAIYLYRQASADISSSILYGAELGEGLRADSAASATLAYNNVFGNGGGEYSGLDDPTGMDGNLSEDPRFVSVTVDDDPTNDDYRLEGDSPSIDAGNPNRAYQDPDRTRNDQGAFGGPGAGWDEDAATAPARPGPRLEGPRQ